MADITIVTSYVNLHRDKWPTQVNGKIIPPYQFRTAATYFQYFKNLAVIENEIVVFTTTDYVQLVKDIRGKKPTTVINIDGIFNGYDTLLKRMNKVMQNPTFINFVTNPQHPEYWNAEYDLINYLKATLVSNAIHVGAVDMSKMIAWIDFGYCRDTNTIPRSCRWSYNFSDNRIHMFSLRPLDARPVFDLVKTGDVYITGPAIVAPATYWPVLDGYIQEKLEFLLDVGLVDDDQTLLLMAYRSNPDIFDIHPLIDPPNKGWFQIFREFNDTAN